MSKNRIFLLLFLTVFLLLYSALAFAVHTSESIFLDIYTYELLYTQRTHWLTTIMIGVTHLGDNTTAIIAIATVTVLLLLRKYYSDICFFLVTMALSGTLNYILKTISARERPEEPWIINETFFSFPSSHTMNATVFFCIVCYFVFKHTKSVLKRALTVFTCTFMTLLMGVSRIYLDVHFFTDVIAGWSAGLAVFITVLFFKHHITMTKSR